MIYAQNQSFQTVWIKSSAYTTILYVLFIYDWIKIKNFNLMLGTYIVPDVEENLFKICKY